MNFSEEQLAEIDKLLKYLQQMEAIVRTSTSSDQVSRVKKQIFQYSERLGRLIPGLDIKRIQVDVLRKQLGLDHGSKPVVGGGGKEEKSKFDILSKYPTIPASPHSTDSEINFLATAINVLQREYWPVLSEQHCKLDYSHATERDAIRAQFESSFRSLKVLIETIEEYAQAEKQDFREQLLKMKNKQSRVLMYEVNDVLKKIIELLKKLVNDINSGGNIIMNKGTMLKFNSRFEEATVLEGSTVDEGLKEFLMYVESLILKLNLPDIKATK